MRRGVSGTATSDGQVTAVRHRCLGVADAIAHNRDGQRVCPLSRPEETLDEAFQRLQLDPVKVLDNRRRAVDRSSVASAFTPDNLTLVLRDGDEDILFLFFWGRFPSWFVAEDVQGSSCNRCSWCLFTVCCADVKVEGGRKTIRLLRCLHAGSRSAVFIGCDHQPSCAVRQEVIVKFVAHPHGVHEASMLRRCVGVDGVPTVLFCGSSCGMQGVDVVARSYVSGDVLDRSSISKPVVASIKKILRQLHRRGLVYRDVKPSNIIVERTSRRPWLIDFDCADDIGAKGFAGTIQFASLRTLKRRVAHPGDDFDSLSLAIASCQ